METVPRNTVEFGSWDKFRTFEQTYKVDFAKYSLYLEVLCEFVVPNTHWSYRCGATSDSLSLWMHDVSCFREMPYAWQSVDKVAMQGCQ